MKHALRMQRLARSCETRDPQRNPATRIAATALTVAGAVGGVAAAPQGSTQALSVSTQGALGQHDSSLASISSDGRYVAFESLASNLVVGDTAYIDVFVHDRQTGVTTRVSVPTQAGVQANSHSYAPSISGDGRFVAFESTASNLVQPDATSRDIYVRDRIAGQTTRVDVSTSGAQANANCFDSAISADGRYVAFHSAADNLVSTDTNGKVDVFVHDRQGATTARASVGPSAAWGNGDSTAASLSADGRYVAFQSKATNLVATNVNGVEQIYVYDRIADLTLLASVSPFGFASDGACAAPSISADGRYVAFESDGTILDPNDSNGVRDAFRRDLQDAVTAVVSSGPSAFGDGPSTACSISGSGRYVAFQSDASNLLATTDTNASKDVFVRDVDLGATVRVSLSTSGTQASGGASFAPSISIDGRATAFHSGAINLIANDNNSFLDVFVREDLSFATTMYCTAKLNSLGCNPTIASVGVPSASQGCCFTIGASNVLNNKNGLFFYGTSGQQGLPFQGGHLCVKAPIERTAVQLSGGNPPPNDCSGTFSLDFNAYVLAGADPALVAGAVVDGQYWARDPGFAAPSNTALTRGIHFTIQP